MTLKQHLYYKIYLTLQAHELDLINTHWLDMINEYGLDFEFKC